MKKTNEPESTKKIKKKKKKSFTGTLLIIIILLIAAVILLLRFGGGLGFGPGGGGSGDGDSVAVMAESKQTVPEETTASAEDGSSTVVTIRVTADAIIIDDMSFANEDQFQEYFYSADRQGKEYILTDDHAVKSLYDAVKLALEKLDCAYSETAA